MKQRTGNSNSNNNNNNNNQYTPHAMHQLQQQTANLNIGNYKQQQQLSNHDSFMNHPVPSILQPNPSDIGNHPSLPSISLRRAQSAPSDFTTQNIDFDNQGGNNINSNNLFFSSAAAHNPNLFVSAASNSNVTASSSSSNRAHHDVGLYSSRTIDSIDLSTSTTKHRQPLPLSGAPPLSLGRSTSLGPSVSYDHDDDDLTLPSKSLAGSKPSLYSSTNPSSSSSSSASSMLDAPRIVTPGFSLPRNTSINNNNPNKQQDNVPDIPISYSGIQPGTVFLSPNLGATSLFSPEMNAVLPRGLGLSPFLSPAMAAPKFDVLSSAMPPLGLPSSFTEQHIQSQGSQMGMNQGNKSAPSSMPYESQDPNAMMSSFNQMYQGQGDLGSGAVTGMGGPQGMMYYPQHLANQMGQPMQGFYGTGADSQYGDANDSQSNMMMMMMPGMAGMTGQYDEQYGMDTAAMGYYTQPYDNQQQMFYNSGDMGNAQGFYGGVGTGYRQQSTYGRGANPMQAGMNPTHMGGSRQAASHRSMNMPSDNSNNNNNSNNNSSTPNIPATLSRGPLNPNSKSWSMPGASNGTPSFMNPMPSQPNAQAGRGAVGTTRATGANRVERAEGSRPRSQLLEEVRTAMKTFSNISGPAGNVPQTPTSSGNQKGAGGARHGGGGNAQSTAAPHQQYQPSSLIPSVETANQMSKLPWKLRDIKGHVLEFAQDQFGSRFIQQNLESKDVSDEDKDDMFKEISNDIADLCRDVFGNYCIQKLLAMGTVSQQYTIVTSAVEGNVLWLSKDTYGCRTVQAMITHVFCTNDGQVNESVIPIERQDKMLLELNGKVLECAQDQNANHVLQVFLEKIRPISRINFVLTAFKGNMKQLAMHFCGCRVVQRVLENASSAREAALRIQRGEGRPGDAGESDMNLGPLLDELVDSANDLVKCQFGNYVIQHLMDHGGDEFAPARRRLVQIVKDNLLQYATHKFASNVVEAVLQHSDKKTRKDVIAVMIKKDPTTGQTLLHAMMKDAYANYVVQRALQTSEPDQLIRVAEIVKSSSSELKKLTYGKHILTALDRALASSNAVSNSSAASVR